METEVRRGATVAMFLVVLLSFCGLGYGVAAASRNLGKDGTQPAEKPVTTMSAKPTQKPAGTPSVAPKPARPAATQRPPTQEAQPQQSTQPKAEPKAGPALLKQGDVGAKVRALQARLRQIAWFAGDVTDSYGTKTVTAVRGFQAKRGIPVTGSVDRETMRRLEKMTHAPSQAELDNKLTPMGNVPGRLDARCETGRALCIDKSSRTLRWVVNGKVLRTVDVRFGSTISNTPTREGLFHVYWKDADHVSREFGSAMPYSMFFSGGQAVHYSSDFAARGYAGASHGCVNVRDYDGIKWLFSRVHVGDPVIVYWS